MALIMSFLLDWRVKEYFLSFGSIFGSVIRLADFSLVYWDSAAKMLEFFWVLLGRCSEMTVFGVRIGLTGRQSSTWMYCYLFSYFGFWFLLALLCFICYCASWDSKGIHWFLIGGSRSERFSIFGGFWILLFLYIIVLFGGILGEGGSYFYVLSCLKAWLLLPRGISTFFRASLLRNYSILSCLFFSIYFIFCFFNSSSWPGSTDLSILI